MAEEKLIGLSTLQHYDAKIKGKAGGALAIEGRVITLKAVDGTVLGTVTVPQTVYELASATANGLLSKEGFVKLEGIAEGATKVEENATNGKITINGSEVAVYIHPNGAKLEAGLYKITTDENGHVTAGTAVTKQDLVALGLPAQDTTYSEATQKAAGLMSAADKSKLDGVSEGATKVTASATNGHVTIDGTDVAVYTHEKFTAKVSGLYKVTVNAEGHISATSPVTKKDLTDLGLPAQDTTYGLATADKEGLQSAAHFTKMQGIESGAQVNKIEEIKVNGVSQTINSKSVNIDLSKYVKKEDVASALTYHGSVDTFAELPTDAAVGDMYNVKAEWTDDEGKHNAGTNVAWNGTVWDAMATALVITTATNADIDKMFA